MKMKIFWIAFVAMLFMVKHSSYGQTLLDFGSNKESTIATNDKEYHISTTFVESLPRSGPRHDCILREVQEVRSAHAQVGLDSNIFQWTTSPPVGGGGQVNNGYVQLNQPGDYIFHIMRKSDGAIWLLAITVSYISDPWVGVDVAATEQSPRLSTFKVVGSPYPKIVAQSSVKWKISSIFANSDYSKSLWRYENEQKTNISSGQIEGEITNSGTYILQTRSGSSCPIERDTFEVVTSTASTYTLTASAGSGGTISPSGNVTVKQGGNQTFTATPDNGKMVDEWKVDGNGVANAGNTYTVSNVQANATVQVTFKDVPPVTFTLTATAGSGGTISPSGSVTVNQGANQTFTATPDNGKMVDEWKVDGNGVASTGNTYTVSNVQANAAIQVTFKDVPPMTFTLTASAESGGTISPSGNVTVKQGESKTFTATPDNGKMVNEWKVDGNGVANAGNTYTVSNVQANATVQVTFKDVPPVEEVPIPVFDGLEGEYTQSSVAIPLKLKGNDSEKFTIFKVNGEVKTEFIPNVKGWYKIEAITADGKSRIETYVNVK